MSGLIATFRCYSVAWIHRNKLQLWEIPSGRLIRTFVDETVNLKDRLPIRFSPKGQLLATADIDHSVKLWNATTGARIITLQGHTQALQSLAFSPDGQTLASSSADDTVRLWKLQTYQTSRVLQVADSSGYPTRPQNAGHLAFSPDGRVLATSALLLPLVESIPQLGQGVKLWDVASGQRWEDIRSVSRFSFSPNNRFLVVAKGSILEVWQPQ